MMRCESEDEYDSAVVFIYLYDLFDPSSISVSFLTPMICDAPWIPHWGGGLSERGSEECPLVLVAYHLCEPA